MIKALIKKLPGIAWLQEGWPDEARFVIQSAALRHVLGDRQLEGACLNAGCGEGLYASFLNSFPNLRRITHMDIDTPNIASRFPNARHEDCAGSVTDLPFVDQEFDACICTEVMEHVVDDGKGFSELARVLKPGGLLLISTPTPPAPYDPNHVREGYTYKDMREHLEQHSFQLLSSTSCFHLTMRMLLVIWRWQFETLGRGQRSMMPRFLVYIAGILDRSLPIGRPWDLVVLARRQLTITA